MGRVEDIAFVGQLLDEYSQTVACFGVAAEDEEDSGVPPAMQSGPVDAEGWVQWKLLPSTLGEEELAEFETELDARFPPLFRAYLLARHQLFDQVHSRKHDQLIFMTDTPTGRPLEPLRDLIAGWQSLLAAGYLPLAEWGDSWGPMCFDLGQQRPDGECPIVWMDHERLIPLDERCSERAAVLPLAQPLYDSCREFLLDVFGQPPAP